MKKGDLIWGILLAAIAAFLLLPATHEIFVSFTNRHPYLSAFIKFPILSTMGELLAIRVKEKDWRSPLGVGYKALVYGFLGIAITLIFQIFSAGIEGAMANGYLPGSARLIYAFWVSAIMNLTFAPTFMAFHRYTDSYIELKCEGNQNVTVDQVVDRIDWKGFIRFVVIKTLPLFWIPAHTITFLLPGQYRVLFAAFLSLALGLLLALGSQKKEVKVNVA